MIAQSVGCSLGCSHCQLGKPVNPLVRRCFQAQTWPFKGSFGGLSEGVGARGGPEKLIKMATGQRRRRVRHEPQPLPLGARSSCCHGGRQ